MRARVPPAWPADSFCFAPSGQPRRRRSPTQVAQVAAVRPKWHMSPRPRELVAFASNGQDLATNNRQAGDFSANG